MTATKFRHEGKPREQEKRPRAVKPQFKAALMENGVLELLIYGDIVDSGTISMLESWGYSTDGFVSSLNVKRALDSAGTYQRIRLRINSPGGDAFEGMAIHSLISSAGKPVDGFIDGIAASSASIVAMSAHNLYMGRVSMMMIHDAWSCCCGNKGDMAKMGATLDKIDEAIAAAYTARTGMSLEDVMALMDAETWLTAQDCIDQGFATGITEQQPEDEVAAMAMARGFKSLNRMKKVPGTLQNKTKDDDLDNANGCECDCPACQEGDCASCSNEGCEDPNCMDCPMQSGTENSATLPAAKNDLAGALDEAKISADKLADSLQRDADTTSLKRARLALAQRRRTT
jgi:ATP-dependent protease ClpP protease subunit